MDRDRKTSLESLEREGIAVLPGVFSRGQIEGARRQVIRQLNFMPNTRPTRSSRHLAGFHRWSELAPLERMIREAPAVVDPLEAFCGGALRSVGMTDITVNRSQQWHKDLMRGPFRGFHETDGLFEQGRGKVFKILVYLQDSRSLQYVPESHCKAISLASDRHAIPSAEEAVSRLPVRAGDVAIMDVRLTHRGSDEAACRGPALERSPRILLSTVLGRVGDPMTWEIERGNRARQERWDRRYGQIAGQFQTVNQGVQL